MAPFIVIVGYPNKPDARFDNDFYINKHMKHVAEVWGPKGMRSWSVIKPLEDANNMLLQVVITWESMEAWKAAGASPEAKQIFADISKFTNIEPTMVKGEVIGAWSSD
ncbi:ethyl tert-butyl ether degradation EthD [Biscogniauxia mediterranea]|nr:ethyl tert-butyl ether degradation EthD [Biscogniauxia mediterranea]